MNSEKKISKGSLICTEKKKWRPIVQHIKDIETYSINEPKRKDFFFFFFFEKKKRKGV